MKQIIQRAIAGLFVLLAANVAYAQTFPTVPSRSVIGRLGTPGTSGPSQAIPFSALVAQLGLNSYAPVFNVANYATPAAAIAAARAAGNGNAVYFPCGAYNLGSGAVGLSVAGASALRLTGAGGVNAGAGQCVMLTYSGTGTMIDADTSFGVEIDHLYLTSTGAGSRLINGDGAFAPYVHDSMLVNSAANASNIGVTLNGSQNALIKRTFFSINGGIGIRGVAPGGAFSVKTTVANNNFNQFNDIAISSPGQAWLISGNISQNPTTGFIRPGPAASCDVVTVVSNDVDDVTPAKTIVQSNCGAMTSIGNRYSNQASGTGIAQDNSTGSVTSIGDQLNGAVGVAIGTGNYLNISGLANTVNLPTALYSGTPLLATAGMARYSLGKSDGVSLALGGVDLAPAYTYKLSAGNGLTNAIIGVGQSSTNAMLMGWTYNATASLGSAAIGTSGYSNPLTLNALNIAINNLSGGATDIYNGGVFPTGTAAYVRATSPTLVTPALGTPSAVVLTNATGTAASLTAGAATNAVNSGVTNDTTTNATMFPVWVTANTGNLPLKVTSTKLSFNPSTGVFTAGGMSFGPSSGASGVYADGVNGVALRTPAGQSIYFQDASGSTLATFDQATSSFAANGTVKGTTGFRLTNLLSSSTAPVATTFCTSPSIPANNGTAAFTINVGTACATSVGTITMPAATTGWVCDFQNVTSPATSVIGQTGGSTTTVTVTNYVRTTGVAGNWTSSDVIRAKCSAY